MNTTEFIKLFDSHFEGKYEYEWDADLCQVTLLCSKKDNVDLDYVRIDFSDDTYSVYKEFLYEDCYGQLATLAIFRDELLFRDSIRQITGENAQCSYEDGMGCPFFSNLVGYFNVPFSWDTLTNAVELIVRSCIKMSERSFECIDATTEEYAVYKELQLNLFEQIKENAPALCDMHIKDSPLNNDHKFDSVYAYINQQRTAIIGVGLEYLLRVCPNANDCVLRTYSGFRYFIARPNNPKAHMTIVDRKWIDEIVNAFSELDEERDVNDYLQYSLDDRSGLIMVYGELWAIISPIKEEHEKCFTYEKNALKCLERDFVAIVPESFWNRTYDFSTLNDSRFELMCRDLMVSMNFKNVHIRGKSHTPDGGVDITAAEEYQTLLGTETRTWIVQCKHTKAQINRKDLSEVRDLLREFDADCYGLFYSGYFSPSTSDRICNICKNDHIMIKAWDHNDLEVLLAKYPRISTEYFGI